jgi:ADP-ribosyl-[dinitrogen reductase] hydrolase
MQTVSRYRGSLLGLAVGDALGAPLEFHAPGSFTPVGDMVSGGAFGLSPGQWTDDTAMALCLAESLVVSKGFDAADQMERYLKWFRQGYMSSVDHCIGIGNTVLNALLRYEQRPAQPYCGSTDPRSAGNGCIMRLAAVPLFFATRPDEAIRLSGESSRTTHGALTCVDACKYLGGLIVGAVNGVSKEELLNERYSPVPEFWREHSLTPEIDEIALGSFKIRNPPEIKGAGYVVKSLEAALWALWHGKSFREGCLLAVNLGDDADTTGAVYGQLAGALYGEWGIPLSWRTKLAHHDLICSLAEEIFSLSQRSAD